MATNSARTALAAGHLAEESLRRLNETLEAKVTERTAQLERAHETVLEEMREREHTEDALRQVQKMEMIGQLTGGVAHDFNNLLMAVMGNLELLSKQANNEKVARLVDGALRGAQRGASLTQRLLAFARQQDLRTEPTHLSDLIRGMTDLLERSVGASIELNFMLPEQLPLTHRRCQPNRTCAPEFGGQRARCDAWRRHDLDTRRHRSLAGRRRSRCRRVCASDS